MGTLPGTDSQIAMGKVQQAFNGVTPGTGSNAPVGSRNVKLSAVLGANYGGVSTGTQISFSSTFRNASTPNPYIP